VKTRPLGPYSVAEIGLGCMNLSHAYGVPPAPEAAERLLLEALDRGVTLFDTAALYGFGANEQLVGRVLKPHRARIVLSSKGGMAGVTGDDGVTRRVIDGRPETIRRNCEDSLRRLGTETIDLYYLHRVDLKQRVPIEDSVGAMSRLVEEGKVRALGLSEASAATLRRAHAVHPIAALQNEYSLWTRNAELGTLEACRELGIAFVAFSPLARAYLTGTLRDVGTFDAKDIRLLMPRFEPANYAKNLALLEGVAAIAREAGCTLAQLALAWLLHRGPHVIPIPGTTNVAHLAENLGARGVALTPAQVERLDALVNQRTVCGPRYAAATQAEIDTEEFPPA
jgi:aryl-alcohol dehydrogenase-like predicted oxidoreductase